MQLPTDAIATYEAINFGCTAQGSTKVLSIDPLERADLMRQVAAAARSGRGPINEPYFAVSIRRPTGETLLGPVCISERNVVAAGRHCFLPRLPVAGR